jgi:hypothetical protein
MDGPKQIGGLPQILDGELEKQRFSRLALLSPPADGVIVGVRLLDRQIEDRRLRCKPRDREIANIPAQGSSGQEGPRNVVQPRLWPSL